MEPNQPDWYAVLDEFNKIDNGYLLDQYTKYLENLEKEERDELKMKYTNEYEKSRRESQYRKKALTTVMGAFLNRGPNSGAVHKKTGWEFWELNPFEAEKDIEADILLAKPDRGDTVVVLLLPERKPVDDVVTESKESIQTIESGPNQFDFGSANDTYGAIVVNPPRDKETHTAIKSNLGAKSSDIFIWRVYDVEESDDSNPNNGIEKKILDYFAELDQKNLSAKGLQLKLLEILEDGVEIRNGKEILPDFFLKSHHSIFLDHILGHTVALRETKDDGPSTHFAEREIKEYISDTVFKTSISAEAAQVTNRLIARWEQMEVIVSIRESRNEIEGENFYRFNTSGNKSQSEIIEQIKDGYKEKTVEFNIEVDAMTDALDAFRDEYGEQATLSPRYTE